MTYKYPLLALFSVVALVGCSDKVSTTTTTTSTTSTAYQIPGELELAKESDSSSSSSASYALFSDDDTDYKKHVTNTYIDGGLDSLDTINTVLKIIEESGYKDYVNKGPYQALITPPGGDEHEPKSADAKSESKVEKLVPMTVNVTRVDGADQPMIIDFWMVMQEDIGTGMVEMMMSMPVKGHIEVTKGADDDTLPWGVFTFDVVGQMDTGSGLVDVFNMSIKTIENADGLAEMEFIETNSEGDIGSVNKIHVIANKSLTSGNFRLIQDGEYTEDLYVTFNGDYYMIKDSSTYANEYSKKLADMTKRVYQYDLFNKETGAKIVLTAGIPLVTSDGGFGYAGTWGVWAENQALIVDGATVTSEGSTPVTYTVVVKNGVLTKHAKVSRTLGDFTGLDLSYYQCTGSGCVDNVVRWNGTYFQIVATRSMEDWTLTSVTPENLTTSNTERWDSAWADSLKTSLRIGELIETGGLSDSTAVTYYVESTVLPGDTTVPTTLYTKEWVPDFSAADGAAFQALSDAHWDCWAADDSACSSTLTYDTDNYMLSSGATELIQPSSLNLTATPNFAWGVWVWGLTANSSDDLDTVDAFYSWSTGVNDWNKYTSLKDSTGTLITLDNPIRMSYVHSTANDKNADSSKNGLMYDIYYDGSHLDFPWAVDSTGNWQPQINLKDGTVLTDGTTEYVVKATDVSMSMKLLTTDPGDTAYVSGLTVDETTSDPTITYNAAVIAAMPTKPTLSSDGTAIKVKVSKGVTIE